MKKVPVDNLSAVIVDDWFTEQEYETAFTEGKLLSSYFGDPSQSGSAVDDEGKPLKNNKSVFLTDVFASWSTSRIAQLSQKKYEKKFVDKMIELDPLFSYLNFINSHDCLVSYYETSDYYKPHRDNSVLTMVTWLYETPKAFRGGDLILRNKDEEIVAEIECLPNRSVIFPGFFLHEVTEISMRPDDMNQNKGRFTISHFSTIAPNQ